MWSRNERGLYLANILSFFEQNARNVLNKQTVFVQINSFFESHVTDVTRRHSSHIFMNFNLLPTWIKLEATDFEWLNK